MTILIKVLALYDYIISRLIFSELVSPNCGGVKWLLQAILDKVYYTIFLFLCVLLKQLSCAISNSVLIISCTCPPTHAVYLVRILIIV